MREQSDPQSGSREIFLRFRLSGIRIVASGGVESVSQDVDQVLKRCGGDKSESQTQQ